jgi:ABC-2 type transport system permease protein
MAMSATLRRLRTSAWLGWQVDSNWTDPTLFVIYAIARPLAAALILVGMYWAVRGPRVHAGLFAGFYLANAFHVIVTTVMVDMGWIVFSEREEYETLRYVVASPVGMRTYLSGRAVVRFARAGVSVMLLLLLGWFVLGIRWSWAHVNAWPLLLSLLLGLAATLFAGLLVAGVAMVLNRSAMTALEGLTLALFLLCGVIFPIDLLPRVLQWVSLALPFTWWYEALRRFLLGHGSSARLAHLSDPALLLGLALVTLATSAASWWAYGALEHRARQLGRIDQTTLF